MLLSLSTSCFSNILNRNISIIEHNCINFRFGQFFLEPLFTESATERELNAVHSEYSKNVANDFRRIYQIIRHMGDPNHDFHKFGTGNLSTLDEVPKSKGINIR